ncbi:choice-of-anchor J domain-containing protein [Flavobacterium sp. XGLA_31]|uniref:choice-of-anchor J domain-containing protein n=1 Tax=Flavobacterium sp. XGLA_31 TaxID=3447666 RepID=UPI003F3BEA3A
MKKITLFLLLLLLASVNGYSQFTPAVEGFESTTGPDAAPATSWTLGTGDWAVFDNDAASGISTAQRWGIMSTVATPPLVYQGTNSAYINRENIGQGNTSEDYLATPMVHIPTNGQLHFYTRTFSSGIQGTIYQIKIAPAVVPEFQTDPTAYSLVQQWTETELVGTFNIYEEKIVDLSAYADLDVYISFVMVYTQTGTVLDGDRWLVDNVSIAENCFAPTNPVAGQITLNSANLSWTGSAPQYEVEIIPQAGTFTGTGTIVNTNSFSATQTTAGVPFAATTTYSYRVRAVCSGGVNSVWVGPTNFTTSSPGLTCLAPITVSTLPYSTTNNTGNFSDSTDVIQPAACAGGATNYMAGNDVFYSYTAPANGTISVTLTPTTANSSLFVYDGCSNVGIACIGGIANTGTGIRDLPNIPVVAGHEYIIVVSSSGVSQTVGYTLVIQAVACAQPTALAASGIAQTTANLSWAAGAATSWEVVVQPAGGPIPTGSGTQTNTNTNYPCPIALTANTSYDFYVRADCNDGSGLFSAWAGPYTFRTLCDAFPVTFQEGFNSTSTTQACWTVVNGNNDADSWNMDYATNPFEGDQVAVLLTDGNGGANDDWLISPQVILNGNQRLRYRYRVQSTNEPNDFRVMLSTNGASTVDFTTTLVPLNSYSNTTYVENIVNLSAYTGPVNVAFHVPAGGLDGWRLYIDNFIIEDLPTCPEPSAITSNSVLSTSANISWTPGNTETEWQVLTLPCGSPAPGAGATPTATATTNVNFPLTDLTPTTCYDVYVRAVCPGNDLSPWTGPTTFTTQVAPPICGGTFTDPGGSGANYANSTDSTVTICPQNATDVVTVTFTSFNTETGWDGLLVYDGNSITAPQIASANGTGNGFFGTVTGAYWGTAIPGPFTSSSADGCLTFRFVSDTSVNNPGWVANVTCAPPPTCRKPTVLTNNTVTYNSALLNWTQPVNPDNSTATAWEVIALPCGSTPPAANATPTTTASTNSNFLLSGLTSATCYDVYVRAVCSDTDSSTWTGPTTFTTQVAPPVCGGNFVDAAGPSANYANSSDSTVTICPNTAGEVVTVTFTSFWTEATWDGLYVFDGNSIAAPQIASTNGAGNVPGGLPGSYWGNLTGANLPGPFTSSSADGCLTFRFRSDGSVNNPGWIANITCAPAPQCPKPNTLTATQITSTSALLGWTEMNPNVAQWQVYLVLQGQPAPLPDTATGWVTVSSTSAPFTGLQSGTQYTFYVRSICPDGSYSLWSVAHNFSTLIINDDCSGAIFAPVNSSAECGQITAGTITAATASTVPLDAPCVGTADDDVWFQFIATNQYLNVSLQSIVGTTTNLNFAAYSGECGTLTQIFCSAANAVSGVLNGLTVGQTYYIRVYSNGSTPQTVNFNLCISTPSTCPTASTVCSLTDYVNTTGVANLGTIGCLFTAPNPAYFTIQVATSGPINYTLTQSTQPSVNGVPGPPNIDVDYAAWGPFTSQDEACTFIGSAQPYAPPGIGVPVTQQTGCSYSAAPTETLNIANAVAGQFYIILITNFSNQPGYITLTQNNTGTAGHGETNCCPNASFNYNPVTYCREAGAPNPTPQINSGSVAGTFTASPDGLVFVDTATGQVDLAASTAGNYVVTNTVAETATCAERTSNATIQIVEPVTATFTYGSASYCNVLFTTPQPATLEGATGGSYSASPNGGLYVDVTTGAITPSLSSPGVYTVTYTLPGSGSCVASNPTATVEIIGAPEPTFTQVPPICPGDALADLPTTSNDGITGTWSPAMNNTATTTYTFTPDAGQCATTTTMTIEVGSTTPTFTQVAPICPGAPLADLPTTSINGVVGTWSPAMDNTQTTTYTFTPTTGNCVASVTMTIVVQTPSIVPTFNAVPPICPNGTLTDLPTTSLNGITGTWSPALDNTQTATYTFTPDAGQCALPTTLTIIVNPELQVTVNNPSFCPGSTATVVATPAIAGNYNYVWTVPAGASDPGNVASFTTNVPGNYSVVITQVNTFCNSDFETPAATGTTPNLVSETAVPCWDTTSSDGIIELWPTGFEGVTPYSGNNLVELNANTPGTLFQDFTVVPGTTISVSFAHRGRQGVDVVGVEVGPVGGPYVSLGNFSDGNTAWALHTVNYTIPTGAGSNYSLRFVSVSSAGGSPSIGNLLDSISISTLGCPSQPTTGVVSIQNLPAPTVTVTQPTCTQPTGTIEVTSPLNGAGGGLPANLFISEVTDAPTGLGALTYVEIYNGTGATVNLSNYKLKMYNNGSSSVNPSCDNILSGMLNNNSTVVVAVGSSTNQGGVTPNLVFAGCTGVNDNDNIRLATTSDVDIDIWGSITDVSFTPSGQAGYTYRRLNTATVPSTTWNPADWTAIDDVAGVVDYSNIGTYSLPNSSTYEYSLDSGTYQSSTTFTGVVSGPHTITVHDLVTGCYSLPFDVTVDPIIDQIITTFNPITICNGDAVSFPAASLEGVTGTWSPSTIDNTQTGTYNFTPDAGLCASTATLTVTVNQPATPTFDPVAAICEGDVLNALPTTSTGVVSGITGSWSPALNNMATTTYTFTPDAGQCATTTTLTIVVNQKVVPTFTPVAAICNGDTLAALPTTSNAPELVPGTWSPALNNTATTTYTFTPAAGQCSNTATLTITVNQKVPSTFNAIAPLCNGSATVPTLPTTSNEGTTGTWSPDTISNTETATYTFTPDAGQCAETGSLTVTVADPLAITAIGDCQGSYFVLTVSPTTGTFDPAATFSWATSSGQVVGNTQSINALTADTYTVTVTINGCSSEQDVIVEPADLACVIQKGISVNGDGYNDAFDLSGFNVKKITIFNRYGMEVYSKTDYTNQWKGESDNGDELPDGTYYYVFDRANGETRTGWIYINRQQ